MEERRFPYISFGISIILMLALIGCIIFELISYIEVSPKAQSGAELAPLAVFFVVFPFMAIPGAISSCYCGIKAKQVWAKVVSFTMLAVFLMVLFPYVAALLRWGEVVRAIIKAAMWFASLFMG